MTKKIVHQKRVGNQFWAGEYYEWECGCIEVKFFDGKSSYRRKLCSDDHEKLNELEKRCLTNFAVH